MNSKLTALIAFALFVPLFSTTIHAQTSAKMNPVFLEPGKVVLEQNFNDGKVTFAEGVFEPAQRTEWKVENGVLVGYPSPQEFQEKKKSHNGAIPVIDISLYPDHQNVIAKFDIKFSESGRVEFGHKVTSLDFRKETIRLGGGGSSAGTGVAVEKDKWYSLVGELKDDELVITIDGIGSLYVQGDSIKEKKKGSIRIRGEAPIYLDNIVVYDVKGVAPGWETRKKEIVEKKAKQD